MADQGTTTTTTTTTATPAADANQTQSEDSSIFLTMQSDIAARVIRGLEKERASELRLKKKIMNDMIAAVHGNTTDAILAQAEESLIKVREFIENFFSYKGTSGLQELWQQVQQLLDMLEPFTQLPGIKVPIVGDVGQMVNDFVMMNKIIKESLTEEEKKRINEELKKNKDDKSFAEKIGGKIEEQAEQTWEAVQILIDEIPRIKEDLYQMCIENAWGIIVKICKMLGIPIDTFPFNLLMEIPEITKLAKQLRTNGKQMLKDSFRDMMLPVYLAETMGDSYQLKEDRQLSTICMALAQNSIEIEYETAQKHLADLKLSQARCAQDIKDTEKKIASLKNRMNAYNATQFPDIAEMISVFTDEAKERKSILERSRERIISDIEKQATLATKLSDRVKDKNAILAIASADYAACTKQVNERNAEVAKAQEAYKKIKADREAAKKAKDDADKENLQKGADASTPA